MSFTVNVDLANPGQFYACCGLFEVANRLTPGKPAEAHFEKSRLHVRSELSLKDVLNSIADCHVTNTMKPSENARFEELTKMTVKERKQQQVAKDELKDLEKLMRISPIVLKGAIDLTLDWFTDNVSGGSRLKTWAGQQSVLDITLAMKRPLEKTEWRDENCLFFSVAGCGLPFNFDSELGRQGSARDVGFSIDKLSGSSRTRIERRARPALELLSFVGLQRFRPQWIKSSNHFAYSVWKNPLPISIAGAAASGSMPVLNSITFEFNLLYKNDYYKSFLPAIPFSGVFDE